ncbi:M14 family metallopeptidase [Solimonas marina]|uniref:Carboxypeptidase family protein n=1 Tax=Solimonas marina TaxID=2714601 RepID=A0A969W9X5_9GAMM|nr:M14-type cytosolic carboxypeptidase [Solimonas marina]NKF22604.1 carboxypeptidase family protein [Solimonas marina]
MSISISGKIPTGSIEVVDEHDAANLQLRLLRDPGDDHLAIGYYHFRASGIRGQSCTYRILDVAEDASARLAGREGYEDGWTNTGPHASYDLKHWFRIPATLEGRDYVFSHVPEHDVCYYARWAPYPPQREMDFIARCQRSPRVSLSTFGRSGLGADLDLMTIGTPGPGKKACWIISRQHPSETMSGYFVEGAVERLLDEHDPIVTSLLQRAVFYVVPNINPDGTQLGHTRANGLGYNLNREWVAPSLERSPEVFHTQALMKKLGVDFCIDCHGDEELRCVFLGGPLEIPSRSEHLDTLFKTFERAWNAASPDYELGHPYPGGSPAEADLRMAWNWIAEEYNCLSVLLEQPFKDTSWWQDPIQGWSPERATRLGRELPTAVHGVLDQLR